MPCGDAVALRQMFTTHGLPLAFYGDRLNVFVRNDRHWTLAEELQGTQHPTHLGRMLQAFGLGLIPFSAQYLLLRGFYAFEDTRTPFRMAVWISGIKNAHATPRSDCL